MLDSYFHVEIGGVKYRLAESAEGEHYRYSGEPLRNQNYAVVEGAENALFQMHPTSKIWSWTDWSGGEGQFKYDSDNQGGYWMGNIINPLEYIGTLRPGPATEQTVKSVGGAFDKNVLMVRAANKLYAVDQEDRVVYEWVDASSWWGAGASNAAGTAVTGAAAVCGDKTYLYYKETTTDNIFKYDGATFTLWNTDTSVDNRNVAMVSLGKYIYLYEILTSKVWEIPKTGAAPVASVLLFNFSDEGGELSDRGKCMMVPGHNRVYFFQLAEQDTVVYEITPTTASGTGFAKEIARIDGFQGEAISFHMGYLYIIGKNTNDTASTATARLVLYLQPGGDYGTLGNLRLDEAHASLPTTGDANSMLLCLFTTRTSTEAKPLLFAIDSVTGGIVCLTRYEYTSGDTVVSESLVQHRGEVFWATDDDATGNGVYRTLRGKYFPADSDDSYVISPVWDFGLVDNKILQSLRINTEPMPADWTVHIDYQKDQNGTWTNAGGYTTDNGTGITYAVSTDSSTVEFFNLQLRIRFQYTGAGNPTTFPILLGVEARAAVLAPVHMWDLLLELSDEDGQAQNRSLSGTAQIANLDTAFATEAIVDFKNGYISRSPNVYNSYDVFVDGWTMILDKPGEGVAAVRLVKVS